MALKLGYSLRNCAEIIEFKGITTKQRNVKKKKVNDFSADNAFKTLKTAKWNRPQRIPFAENMNSLYDYIKKEERDSERKMSECSSDTLWINLQN